jgi:hypothetical protein
VVAEASRLMDEAEAAVAADAAIAQRVAVARLPVTYTQIMQAKAGDADALARLDAFEKTARAAGLTMVREHGGTGRLDAWLEAQRKRLGAGK